MNFSEFLKEDQQKNINTINRNMYQLQVQPKRQQKNKVERFDNEYKNRTQLQTQQYQGLELNKHLGPPKIEKPSTVLTARCVNIDSRDRNRNNYPTSNNFQVQMNPSNTFSGAALFENFRNIYSIRLIEAVLPDFSGDQPYLTLVIPELQDTMSGTNDTLKKSFAILYPDRVLTNFVSCRVKDMCYCFKKFNPPLANIRSLTFQFFDPDGTLHDFGTDTNPPTAVTNTVQVMLTIEITIIASNRAPLEAMPIFA